MTEQRVSQRPNVECETHGLQDAMLIGIGNDGRQDDGLGWAFLDEIQQAENFCGPVLYRYQLQIEDAEIISHARRVVFVDSCQLQLPNGFQWQPCVPTDEFEFTTHSLAPSTVVSLCQQLYPHTPQADLLLIQGHAWELQIGLSPVAKSNLKCALQFWNSRLST